MFHSQQSSCLAQLKVVQLLQKYITTDLSYVTYFDFRIEQKVDTQFALNHLHPQGSHVTHLQWPVGGKGLREMLGHINCLLCLKR